MDLGDSVIPFHLRSGCRPFFVNQRACFCIGSLFSLVEIEKRPPALVRDIAKRSLNFYGMP
jgi:hypothetical protein